MFKEDKVDVQNHKGDFEEKKNVGLYEEVTSRRSVLVYGWIGFNQETVESFAILRFNGNSDKR